MKWCCDGFKGRYDDAGLRGTSILAIGTAYPRLYCNFVLQTWDFRKLSTLSDPK